MRWGIVAALAMGAVCEAQVLLRGGERIETPATAVDAAGVHVGDRIIPWDRVRIVEGEHAEAARAFAEISETLWRAKARLERGDVTLAEPLFEEAFEQLRGEEGPTSLTAAEGLLRCRLARGARASAVEAWLEALRLRRAGASVSFRGSPVMDEETGLAPLLAPVWEDDAAVRELARVEGGRSADFVVATIDDVYRFAAANAVGLAGAAPVVGPEVGADAGVALVRAVVDAMHGEGERRAQARDWLRSGMARDVGTWREAWRRVGLGMNLIAEPDGATRRRGMLELAHVPARFSASQPALSAIALRALAGAMETTGDGDAGADLREEASALASAEGGVGVWTTGMGAREAGDALERFLESRGLRSLLVEHLEERLAQSPAADKLALAERLSAIYSELLSEAESGEERAELERRARALLSEVPDAESADLRLNLHRASYLRAEEVAERHRLRLASAAELEEAERSLRALGPELARIGALAHRRVEGLEKQEESGREFDLDVLAEALSAARRQRSLAMYLAGWSTVYLAELTNSGPTAVEAMRHFGWLLNAESGQTPSIERVSKGMLRYEHIARSAIGVATAASVRGAPEEALAWLDLIEQAEEAPPMVKDQVFARRATTLARASQWMELRRLVSLRRGESVDGARTRTVAAPLSPNEARLIAVLAFEERVEKGDVSIARELRATALGDLVAADQLAQVVDLARRYGTEPLGDGGFIVDYVRGLLTYQRAREAHAASAGDPEAPTGDRELVGLYESAEALLAAAEASAQGAKFPDALADARLLRGLAMYYASASSAGGGAQTRAMAASAQFIAAAEGATKEAVRADALWMALRSLEAAGEIKGPRTDEAKTRRLELEESFIASFPADERAGRLLIRRSSEGGLEPAEAVSRLLATPLESPMRIAAEREAARQLFGMTREGSAAARARAAGQFVEVASGLLSRDKASALRGDVEAADRAVLLARQVMEASLSHEGLDPRSAALAAESLEELRAARMVDLSPYEEELLFRRLQASARLGDEAEAERLADLLHERAMSGGGVFSRAGLGLMLQRAAAAWRAGPQDEARARAMVKQGVRALAVDWSGLSDAARLTVRVYIGEAAAWLWDATKDESMRSLAIEAHRLALEKQPTDGALLRRMAALSAAAGDSEAALQSWRVLLAGSDIASASWFEATTHVIELTAELDPETARSMLDRHVLLYPNYGPAPWGDRLRAVDERVPRGEGTP